MRWCLAPALALIACTALAQRIVLIPLDSRPAAGHFAQLIARMANVEVVLPPYELLGRYTTAGNPDAILDWLSAQDMSDVLAVVASIDMAAFGGLIASRVSDTKIEVALKRLSRLVEIRKRNTKTKFFAFSAIMRLYPTATRATAAWRLNLGRYQEVKDRFRRTQSPAHRQTLQNLLAKIPPMEIQRYEATRVRNHQLQRALLGMVKEGAFDYVVLGQDDAQPYGPHIPEQLALKQLADQYLLGGRVYMCEGIDQLANVLVSRALLRGNDWLPRVRVVYSDPAGRGKVANYESKNIGLSVLDQLIASGARPVGPDGNHDYTLFLNTPNPREGPFRSFVQQLTDEVEQGFPVAVADINLGKDGTADQTLFAILGEDRRMMRLLSYAGWNTAGNTLGTAIPAANVYLLARRLQIDPLARETAQREFLLHRFVNDFEYHRFTRPAAYKLIDSMPRASREETYGSDFEAVNRLVQSDLTKRLFDTFEQQFRGRRFFAGTGQYQFSGLESVRVLLPWPRAYEVRLEFRMKAEPATDGTR